MTIQHATKHKSHIINPSPPSLHKDSRVIVCKGKYTGYRLYFTLVLLADGRE